MTTNRNPWPVGGGALSSEFAGDPEMTDLIRMFVDEMPQRVDALMESWERGAVADLRRLAHQLKGASGGYGFPALGQAAGALETGLAAAGECATGADLQRLNMQLDELVDMCRRVTAGPGGDD